jgi:hypothetical protein
MPCGKKFIVLRHNFGPSLTIIMNDGDQYFEKKTILCQKIFIMPHDIFQ